MFDVKEISDRRTNFSFEVTNRRDGRQFYVGNRKGFDDYILIQALLDPEKLFPRVTILDKDAYSKLTRRLQAEMARKGVFYETLDNPLGEVKLAKTLVASTLTEEKLIEAIWDVIAATIILRAEIGIALDK